MDLKKIIDEISNFPKKGINFKDITPLLKNPEAFRFAINEMSKWVIKTGSTKIAGTESRGFIFGAAIAFHLGIPFILIRKPGKLPKKIFSQSYTLEYGEDTLEIHQEDIQKGDRVYLTDDLLATGGTIAASTKLIKKSGAKISGMGFLIELGFLNGRGKLESGEIESLVKY